MIRAVFWVLGVVVALALVAPRAATFVAPPPSALVPVVMPATPAATPTLPAGNGYAEAVIARAPDGHFYADALINGAHMRLMIDTGATTVALTRADAQAAGLQFAPGDFTATGQGAGGPIRLKPVTLDRVAIGPVTASGVEAVIADSPLPLSLIGQSFLRRIGHVEISDDRLVLR